MSSYILRTIDPVLWARVKARAEQDGYPLRRVILALLALYADGGVSITTTAR